jgi:hypothetical protein
MVADSISIARLPIEVNDLAKSALTLSGTTLQRRKQRPQTQ